MKVFTIGFTKKSARDFFGKLSRPEIKRLVDVRLNNVSQLAGFAKKDDLRFFAEAICHIEYVHLPELAPTKSAAANVAVPMRPRNAARSETYLSTGLSST